MLDIFNEYATDEKAEVEGVEIELKGGAKIKVARAQNINFLRKITELSEKYSQEMQNLPAEKAKELDMKLMCEALAETILLGFEGLSYQGKALKYNKENAMKILAHKDFRVLVLQHANNMENYRLKKDADDSKN